MYKTITFDLRGYRISQNLLSLFLIFPLYTGLLVVLFNQNTGPLSRRFDPATSGARMCVAPIEIAGSARSKAHAGTVNTPVGSKISGLLRWSAASSWEGGQKPSSGEDVFVPAKSVLVLDQNVDVKSITVEGKLIVDLTKDISISVEYILIQNSTGYFEWGTEQEKYTKKGVITLVGNDKTAKIPGTSVESKAIMVMGGATMELHGEEKTSWTTLATNASSGQNKIVITDNNSNWKVGDQIVIAPSRLNWNEGEKRTITAINEGNITLNANLNYPHIGSRRSYTRPQDGKTWESDMRAEVGLLSKSIKIQGDESSQSNFFGGHIMIHMIGMAHLENIELYKMGQKSILGRYPFHWHLVQENGNGQYLKNSSIHNTYNRAITIHGTESTLVENNFCYDHIGHGIFLEDGSERFNTIRGNVVLLTKRPAAGEELTPSDNEMNEVQNRTPASFWITNPNNTYVNNVAAGTQGTGFWFAMPQKPMGLSANLSRFSGLQPHKEPLGKFDGNKAHSCKSGFDIFDQLSATHSITRNAPWQRTDKRYIENCTWYANELAVYGGIGGGRAYTQGVVFTDNVFSDNMYNVMHANYSLIEQSLFVANSGDNVFNGERYLNKGYDGACTIKDCHLVGWDTSNANYVHNTGGANKHTNYRISGITLSPDRSARMSFPSYEGIPKGGVGANATAHPRFWSYVHWDMDGSLSGKPNTSIVTNHPLCRDGTEVRYANWNNLFRTDRRFAYMTAQGGGNPKMTLVRTKPGTPKAGQYYINDDGTGFYGQFIQFPVMVNDGFLYTMQFDKLSTDKKLTLRMADAYTSGDEVLYRIKDFGRLGGLTVSNASNKTSLDAVKSGSSSAWAIVGNDLYLKMKAGTSPDFSCVISWSNYITLPILDTDGDGISDYEESKAGTDPVGNDVIPAAKVIDWIPTQVANIAPSVAFMEPAFSSIEEGYDSLYVLANAADSDGSIAKTELYIDGKLIRQESVAPYEWGHANSPNFMETAGLSVGNHELKVVAIDDDGAQSFATKTITVTRVNKAPEVQITSPFEMEIFYVGEDITIRAQATDDRAVEKVNFKLNGAYHSQDQTANNGEYSTTMTFTSAGTYTIGARAFDGEGGSTEVSVNIEVRDEIITQNVAGRDEQFKIYPNPTNGEVHLSKTMPWRIMNLQGLEILSGKSDLIDLSSFDIGVYFLLVEEKVYKIMRE